MLMGVDCYGIRRAEALDRYGIHTAAAPARFVEGTQGCRDAAAKRGEHSRAGASRSASGLSGERAAAL
jgi:hypothetical protein